MLVTPIFITNFKTYEQSIGNNAVELAKMHERVAREMGKSIGVCVSALDVYRVSQAVSIPVFAQHIDPVDYGSNTGSVLAQNVRNAGACGTLINHSEKRLDPEVLSNTVVYAQKSSLARIICAESPKEIGKFAQLDPDFLAFEPPELIGGKKSVSSEQPDSIRDSVENAFGIPVLVGAGIHTSKDIQIALKLGAKGFLVASGIVKAQNPEKALRSLVTMME